MVFSPDGEPLVGRLRTDYGILRPVSNLGQPLCSFFHGDAEVGHFFKTRTVSDVAFSPDGNLSPASASIPSLGQSRQTI